MNRIIVEQFERLVEQIKYDMDRVKTRQKAIQQGMRLRAIKNVLEIIKKYPKKIKSGDELAHIKGVGKGTITRIDEIIKKGYLSEIRKDRGIQKYLKYIEELEQIFGIGRKTAAKLVMKHGIKTIKDLKDAHKKGKIDLNDHILLGLKYHGVYKEVIPRKEIEQVDKLLNKADKISGGLNHRICGSFRRGKPFSNDIDILLTHKDVKNKTQLANSKNYLKLYVKKLKDMGLIVEDIDKDFEVKYMGFSKMGKNPVRRVDIMYVPYDSYPTALLHFTGSGEFNRKMRELALELGYTLNQYGLYKVDRGKKKRIPTNSEKDVFESLGMEYVEPKLRS